MIYYLKKINLVLKKNHIDLIYSAKYSFNLIISTINYFRIFTINNLNFLNIPNLAVKNTIYINPNKIKYINAIPMKFQKSTKLIQNFDWDKTNRNLESYSHDTYITCHELFVENKKIEKCKNYFLFKEILNKKKKYKNIFNEKDLINFFKQKIKLFENIKKFGVKKNRLFNIQLMVDKNLNLVKINSGNHRFFISRILKIKSIPAEIKLIHSSHLVNLKINKNMKLKYLNNFIKKIELDYK